MKSAQGAYNVFGIRLQVILLRHSFFKIQMGLPCTQTSSSCNSLDDECIMFLWNNKFLRMLFEAFQNLPVAENSSHPFYGWSLTPLKRDERADSSRAFQKRLKNHPAGKMKLPAAPLGGISVSLQQAAGYQSGIAP